MRLIGTGEEEEEEEEEGEAKGNNTVLRLQRKEK